MSNYSKKEKRLGERRQMNCGAWAQIVEYKNCKQILVRFDNGYESWSSYAKFQKGDIKNHPNSKKDERLGKCRQMNDGSFAKIIEYKNNHEILVRFDDGWDTWTRYSAFLSGNVSRQSQQRTERLGERHQMNCGSWAEIIEYNNHRNIVLRFDSGPKTKTTRYTRFKTGSVSDPNIKRTTYNHPSNPKIRILDPHHYDYLIGEKNTMNNGEIATIISVRSKKDITVEFENGYQTDVSYHTFQNGEVANPLIPTVYGVGYLGVGPYLSVVDGKSQKAYDTWHGMLRRAYSNSERYLTYKDTTVCQEWHNFQNFAKWYEENYYEIDGQQMHLDKDLKSGKSKMYSPETCLFIPQVLNAQLIDRTAKRTNELPLGVHFNTWNPLRYTAKINIGEKKQLAATFDTIEEAEYWYKEQKTKRIHQLANEFQKQLPRLVYETLMNWKA